MSLFSSSDLRQKDGWYYAVIFLACIVIVPIVVILGSLFLPEKEILRHLLETILPTLVSNTFFLLIGVIGVTAVLGISLGWLTGACSFPGQKFFSWALCLPMAIPAYVMAFIFLGLMDFAGPVQTLLRTLPGFERMVVDVRTTPFVVLVISLTLYPYVYLLSRGAFLSQGRALMEASRSLGASPTKAFFKVALPMAKPWIFSGLALVMMETLADFGAVSIFNYDTFTTAIYKSWFGFFSLEAAAQLSSALVILALVLILIETRQRKRCYSPVGKCVSQHSKLVLSGGSRWCAFLYCAFVLLIAFVIPVCQLLLWVAKMSGAGEIQNYLGLTGKTLFLGVSATLLTCLCALILAYGKRRSKSPFIFILTRICTMGYALPGTVLAVGIFLPITWFDNVLQDTLLHLFGMDTGNIIQGTVLVMLVAYIVRFLAAGFGAVDSSMQGIGAHLDQAASLVGIKGRRLLHKVHLPLMKKGIFTALLLVMIDVVKEMPITLMTRPFGWDTLAVKIYELTSEGEWERASLPALYLILVSIIPVIFLIRRSEESKC